MGDAVDRALSENHALIAAILEHHSSGRHVPAVALLERLQGNLEFVAAVAEHGVPLAPAVSPPRTLAPRLAPAATATAATTPNVSLAPAPPPVSVSSPVPGPVSAPAQTSAPQTQTMYWTNEEHERFERAMELHGRAGRDGKPDFKAIATFVGSRTPVQVRSHLQKVLKRVERAGEGGGDKDTE